jgi:hypothetical protein
MDDKKDLPILPKGWRKTEEYKELKEVVKSEEFNFIKIEDIELNTVYRTHVKDLVKVLVIDNEKQKIKLYNISGAHKQWLDFKNVAFIEKI